MYQTDPKLLKMLKLSPPKVGWGENKMDGIGREKNVGENVVFHYLVQERKIEGKKIKLKKITLVPQIFMLPIWEEN